MWVANGILFNHESPRRGETFVTRKITRALARMRLGLQERLTLGNLYAKRDWGYAPDYVKAMWMVLQLPQPDDFVIATGESHTVKEFVDAAFGHAGYSLEWKGEGLEERALDADTGDVRVEVSERYFRPSEVDSLLGDPRKAQERMGWEPSVAFQELVATMVEGDHERERKRLEGTNG